MSSVFVRSMFKVINKVLDFFLSVLAERKGRLSIGRLLLISIFVLAMIKWAEGIDLLPSMLTIMLALLGYVMGTKVVGNVTGVIQKNGDTNVSTSVSVEGSKKVSNATNKNDEDSKKTPDIED